MPPLSLAPDRFDYRIEPVGERCLLVRLGDSVSVQTSHAVHHVTALLEAANLPGVIDIVPAFTTVALHYQPQVDTDNHARLRPFMHMQATVRALLNTHIPIQSAPGRLIEIPACYGGRFGPDLEEVAERCKLLPDEVIARHTAIEQVIYTFFFAPGHPFCGPLGDELHVPRRTSPRTNVPAGSVAIANGITTIYQTASPGGWSLIARTPRNLFDIRQTPPSPLAIGDRIKFVAISEAEFDTQYEDRS